MIARQTQEVFADCHDGDTNIRVSTWIEKLLAVKDNLEYGIVSSERTTNRWAYMDENFYDGFPYSFGAEFIPAECLTD